MKTKLTVCGFFLAALALTGQGCLGGSNGPGLDGGVFRTENNGAEWRQLKTLNLGASIGSIADLGTASVAIDPEDPLAIYVGTNENGLVMTLDGGDSWTPMKGLTLGRINAVAVDPKNKCTLFAARANQIFKTTNCGRDWNQAFFDPRTDKFFTALAIDWFNPQILYAGNNDGDVYRSDSSGATWRAVYRVDGVKINTLAIDTRDSRMVYAATDGAGILKTADGGATWDRISKPFQDFEGARRVTALALDPHAAGIVYAASRYGVLKTEDSGATWKPLPLPTPTGSVMIRAFLVHPKNSKLLTYATDSSIVWSTDGGTTWSPKKLPSSRGVAFMVWDMLPGASRLYLGAAPKKE